MARKKKGASVSTTTQSADGGLETSEQASFVGDAGEIDAGSDESFDGEGEIAKETPHAPPANIDEWADEVEQVNAEIADQEEKVKRAAARLKDARSRLRQLNTELREAITQRGQMKMKFPEGGPRPDPDGPDAEHIDGGRVLGGPGSSPKTAGKKSRVPGFGAGRKEV